MSGSDELVAIAICLIAVGATTYGSQEGLHTDKNVSST